MTRDEAIRKVAALLRLAARPGTAGEAANAAALAEKLMHRFEIEAASAIDMHEREPDEDISTFHAVPDGELAKFGRFNWSQWHWRLGSSIARLHGCYTFKGRRADSVTIEIVGRPSKVEAVRYLFGWLSGAVSELTAAHGKGLGTNWRRQFSEGCVDAIIERMTQQQQTTAQEIKAEHVSNPYALQRIEQGLQRLAVETKQVEAWATVKLRLTTVRSSGGGSFNRTARDSGREAGRSINLNASRGALAGRNKQLPS